MTRQTYQLPINVIIEIMQGLHERVTLCTRIPTLPGSARQECMASILVDKHGLQACVITECNTEERLFEREEALGIVAQCGTLAWVLQPAAADSLLTGLALEQTSSSQIPSRQMELTSGQMQTLPSAQKKVFALVNGKNTVEYIAHLLRKTPQEVQYVLLELKQQYMIDL